jgi:FAD/FMN-containing dehydrogenase
LQEFKASVRGPLLRPGDVGYNEARKVFNAMHDKHPALIVRCTGVVDVIAAVTFARIHDPLVAVRGGDHSVAGHSICTGGLMIDLPLMKSVRVNTTKQTACAEGGAR